MRKLLDFVTWGFLFVFFVPCMLIIASWNSLPGNILYPAKLALEHAVLLFSSPLYAVESQLNITYTERRFAESRRLLADQHSIIGLPYLEAQVAATKAVIYRAPTHQKKTEVAREYISTLQMVSFQLEQEEQVIVGGQVSQTQAETGNTGLELTKDTSFAPLVVSRTVSIPSTTQIPAATPTGGVFAASLPTASPIPANIADTNRVASPAVLPSTTPIPTPTIKHNRTVIDLPAGGSSDTLAIQKGIAYTQTILDRTIHDLSKIVDESPDVTGRPSGRSGIREEQNPTDTNNQQMEESRRTVSTEATAASALESFAKTATGTPTIPFEETAQ